MRTSYENLLNAQESARQLGTWDLGKSNCVQVSLNPKP